MANKKYNKHEVNIIKSKKVTFDDLIEAKEHSLKLLLHLPYPSKLFLVILLLLKLFLSAFFDKQLKLIIWILIFSLFDQILPNVNTFNSSCAFLELLTIVTQDCDVQVFIVELNHAGFSLPCMKGLALGRGGQLVLPRVTGLGFLRAMLDMGFFLPVSGLILFHCDDGLQFSMSVVITCNWHFVLFVQEGLFLPGLLIMQWGEFSCSFFSGVDIDVVV